jgi:transposase
MVKVAVRVPGERRGTRKTDVLEFRTFYGVLEEMGRELRRRGVTHVVMEASGVYTEPVYYALAGLDFTEVMVINPAHAKALKGHKTDARDAIRLLDLYECGLLSGSYIPAPDLKEVRDLARYRMKRSRPAPQRSSGCRKRWKRPGSSCPRSCPMLPGYRRRR